MLPERTFYCFCKGEKKMKEAPIERTLAEKIKEKISSPEGKKRIEKVKKRTQQFVEDLREAQIVDPEILNKPITL